LPLRAESLGGARGAGDAIGPDETLVFEVELLSIAKKDQTPAQK